MPSEWVPPRTTSLWWSARLSDPSGRCKGGPCAHQGRPPSARPDGRTGGSTTWSAHCLTYGVHLLLEGVHLLLHVLHVLLWLCLVSLKTGSARWRFLRLCILPSFAIGGNLRFLLVFCSLARSLAFSSGSLRFLLVFLPLAIPIALLSGFDALRDIRLI